MTQKLTYLGFGGILTLIVIAAFSLFYVAKANPNFFIQNPSATATSTPIAFMTAGTATSTYPSVAGFDLGVGGAQGADSAALLVCLQASSTSTTLNTNLEYSQDGQTWFENNLASTTNSNAITVPSQLSWVFASTSIGGAPVSTTTNSDCKTVTVATPTRFVRAIFSLPVGSKNGAVWANFVAKRQSN